MISRYSLLFLATILLVLFTARLSYISGWHAGWDAVECVDVTDPNQFVRRVQQGKRPPFRKACFYDPNYTVVDHLNTLSTFDAAEVKVINGNCIITRY